MMDDEEDLREQILALQAENKRLRETHKQLSQSVLDLEAQIARLQDRLSQMSKGLGFPVEVLGSAVADALALANDNLAKEKGEVQYSITGLSCDVKGFLGATDSSLTVIPAAVIDARTANSMSVIRLSVGNIPASKAGPQEG